MGLVVGQILRTRYQIQRLLGQGGFGAVYQATDLNLQRIVAVKENLDASPAAQKQFQREAQMLVPVRHANLPQILDYFIEANGQQYLVMEFVAGSTLRQLVQQNGILSESQAVAWANQILDALEELHSNNPPIIHRDIKPDNIIITPRGNAMLVDFGIAKAAMPGMPTTIGARAVSPGYSPPEQYGNAPTDTRSDIYAFGATLYFVLTRVEPPESIQRIITNAPLVLPRQYNARISQSVESAILKAMEINPAQRYQTNGQVRQALSQPVTYARPAPVQPTNTVYTPAPPPKAKPTPVTASQRRYMVKPLALGIGISMVLLSLLAFLGLNYGALVLVVLSLVPFLVCIFAAREVRIANGGVFSWRMAIERGFLWGILFVVAIVVAGFLFNGIGLCCVYIGIPELLIPFLSVLGGTCLYRLVTGN